MEYAVKTSIYSKDLEENARKKVESVWKKEKDIVLIYKKDEGFDPRFFLDILKIRAFCDIICVCVYYITISRFLECFGEQSSP